MNRYDVIILLPYQLKEHNLENIRGQILQQGALGAGFLSASLDKSGISNLIIDLKVERLSKKDLISIIKDTGCKLIAISVLAQIQFESGIQIANVIKSSGIEVHVSMGGHFPTLCCDNILSEFQSVDSILCGEGEKNIIRLYNSIIDNTLQKITVPGIRYRDKNGVIKGSKQIINIENIDNLPFPNIPFIETIKKTGNRVNIMAGRGCSENCTYCTIPAFRNNRKRIMHSPAFVVNWIKSLQKQYDIYKFNFIDDVFCDLSTESEEWIDLFCDLVKNSRLIIDFSISIKCKKYNEKSILKLKEVGLTQVFIGVENTSKKILDNYQRDEKIQEIDNTINSLTKLELTVVIGFIFFDPFLTWNDLKANYKWIINHNFYSDHFFNILKPYYGTKIRNILETKGMLKSSSCFECGDFIFLDNKVERLYNKLCTYEKYYAKVNFKVLNLLYLEKANRTINGNRYKKEIGRLYKKEAEIWADIVGKLIEEIELNKILIDVEDVQKKLQNFDADIEISKNKVLHKY